MSASPTSLLPTKPNHRPELVTDKHNHLDHHREAEPNDIARAESEASEGKDEGEVDSSQPPLPTEPLPPLPEEIPRATAPQPVDDGWDAVWDGNAQAYYFYNRYTQITQWENPRIPASAPGVVDSGPPGASTAFLPSKPPALSYDPNIHGDYDPDADYARAYERPQQEASNDPDNPSSDPSAAYAAIATFNRFTGRFQNPDLNPENFNDEAKSKRQMNAFFDVDAAANVHGGKSLKAERQAKKVSKQELKDYREKRKNRQEERKRAWLRD